MAKFNGPYRTSSDRISYIGNRLYSELDDVKRHPWPGFASRTEELASDKRWMNLSKIDASIFEATIEYFRSMGALWTNLPLTTLMISSPGEVYAGRTLDYTTDALPMVFDSWFDINRQVFLAESAQFYLELALSSHEGDSKVFSVYNSFRKERGDETHLSEFQHIEFEGHVSGELCLEIGIGLIDKIICYLLDQNESNLAYFLTEKQMRDLSNTRIQDSARVPFSDALKALLEDTRDKKYSQFTMQHFGAWEEIRLTEIFGSSIILTQFPLLQIPFYHANAASEFEGIPLAENADVVLSGYRETIGSGVRLRDIGALMEKARVFNLPLADYEPYFQIRRMDGYRPSAGFGLGWQRLVQWILCLPFIWEATVFPRGHTIPHP